jgi:lambda family phage portal protein
VAPNPNPILYDHSGRPVKAGTSGRWFRRSGASTQGTLSNWVSQIINNRIAESEKRKISDRAWDLYLNDAMAHGIMEGLVAEIIGTGLTPQAQPMLSWLGLDIEWQTQYQQRIYDLFEIWGLDPRNWCDATRRQNIYMLQCLALFHWKLDGIALFQVLSRQDLARPLALSLLPIDPSRLVTPTDMQNADIYDGVELDSDGAPVAVWIIKEAKFKYSQLYITATSGQCQRIPVHNDVTGLPNVLLVCDVRNIAEYRQDSIFGSMIKELRDNSDFTEAALVKALISNLFALFVEDTYGSQNNSSTDWADRIQEVEKGTIIVGQTGEKPTVIENDAPGPNFEMMFKTIIRRLGMATCRGPENISREYNSSYSASMASMENAGKFDDTDRMVIVNRFCQPVLMWMSYEAVLRGLLPVKSSDAFLQNLYAYTRSEWLPPKARPIDKLKAANADDVRLLNGTRTFSDIFGEQSKDWRVMRRQRAVELAFDRELEEEYDISLSPESFTGKPVAEPTNQEEDKQDAPD